MTRGNPDSLFAFLFDAEARAQAEADYAKAQAEAQKVHPEPAQGASKKPELEQTEEGEPKCWIN